MTNVGHVGLCRDNGKENGDYHSSILKVRVCGLAGRAPLEAFAGDIRFLSLRVQVPKYYRAPLKGSLGDI